MNNNTVVIAGMGGFIGRHLAVALRAAYPRAFIVGLGRGECPDADEMSVVDLLDAERVRALLGRIRPRYIFHLAGNLYSRDWQELYDSNVRTTLNILDAVQRLGAGVKTVIPGSAAEYGAVQARELPVLEARAPNAVSPYGVAKTWQTTVARYYALQGLDVVVGRLFNVIGPGIRDTLSIGAFASQLRKIRRGEMAPNLMVGNLAPKRDFVDVRDVCHALITLAEHGVSGDIYNVCSGQSVSMRYILDELIARFGMDVQVSVDPNRLRSADIEDIYGSNKKLRMIGWEASIPLTDSLSSLTA